VRHLHRWHDLRRRRSPRPVRHRHPEVTPVAPEA
jgi:hypothetical protein